MPNYLSPGVYVRETDFSFYVKQISTASAAMVGVAERGPINKVGLVTSWEQFINKYGGYIADSYLAYAARAFFDNGGRVLYVNRVAHVTDPTDRDTITAVKSSVTLVGRDGVAASLTTGTSGTDEIVWTAQEMGAGGNAISHRLIAAGNDTPLSVSVSGNAVTINLATDASGVPNSTVAEVLAAVADSSNAAGPGFRGLDRHGDRSGRRGGQPRGRRRSADTLRVDAIDEGIWGDGLSIMIEDGSLDPHGRLQHRRPAPRQRRRGLQGPLDGREQGQHAELMINGEVRYITVHDLSVTTGGGVGGPALGEYALVGGGNGLDGLTDSRLHRRFPRSHNGHLRL
jgi:hypothetical protein